MIPPHNTPQEQSAYLRKLADVFAEMAQGPMGDEWPWGDVIPLRAAADTIDRLSGKDAAKEEVGAMTRLEDCRPLAEALIAALEDCDRETDFRRHSIANDIRCLVGMPEAVVETKKP